MGFLIKSQSAVEFIILTTFMLLTVVVFFSIVSTRVLEAKEEGDRIIAEDIANIAFREIEIAKQSNDGYTRFFRMPQTVNGVDYSINVIDNRELIVEYLDFEHIRFLPANVTGNVIKGLNKISKVSGVVSINKD